MQPVYSLRRIQPSALCDRPVMSGKQPAATLWQMKLEFIEWGRRDLGVGGYGWKQGTEFREKVYYSQERQNTQGGKISLGMSKERAESFFFFINLIGSNLKPETIPSCLCVIYKKNKAEVTSLLLHFWAEKVGSHKAEIYFSTTIKELGVWLKISLL